MLCRSREPGTRRRRCNTCEACVARHRTSVLALGSRRRSDHGRARRRGRAPRHTGRPRAEAASTAAGRASVCSTGDAGCRAGATRSSAEPRRVGASRRTAAGSRWASRRRWGFGSRGPRGCALPSFGTRNGHSALGVVDAEPDRGRRGAPRIFVVDPIARRLSRPGGLEGRGGRGRQRATAELVVLGHPDGVGSAPLGWLRARTVRIARSSCGKSGGVPIPRPRAVTDVGGIASRPRRRRRRQADAGRCRRLSRRRGRSPVAGGLVPRARGGRSTSAGCGTGSSRRPRRGAFARQRPPRALARKRASGGHRQDGRSGPRTSAYPCSRT